MSEYVSPEQNRKLMAARTRLTLRHVLPTASMARVPVEFARIADEFYSAYWAAMAHVD